MKRLLIEGWRELHHSYALVAQQHSLCMLERPGIDLRFREIPFFSPRWQRVAGIFDEAAEAKLAGIPSPEPGFAPDATLNMQAERPDFSAPRSGLKFVFGTPEYRVLRHENLAGIATAAAVPQSVHVLTPSRWTAAAYERFGFEPHRIHVVPHGVDPAVVRPEAADREVARQAMGLGDAFVFMSVGAMTGNKGIDLLLRAFGAVASHHPHARLLLKGADALYSSRDSLRAALTALPASARERVASRLLYQGSTFSARQMATFMRAADCYVAPYFAEGFNMPVLEAAGCGVPVICTEGGPTDEFTTFDFASRVTSTPIEVALDHGQTGDALQPDYEHLVQCMVSAASDPEATQARGVAAARHVAQNYTWAKVTDRLLAEMLGTDGRVSSSRESPAGKPDVVDEGLR
ncbi:MAG: glycosyltransferase family 4 protein [Pseudomonadota bacterium]|nr:glycosyltransferase family 4 protein [Pseudomonadota bacterium]